MPIVIVELGRTESRVGQVVDIGATPTQNENIVGKFQRNRGITHSDGLEFKRKRVVGPKWAKNKPSGETLSPLLDPCLETRERPFPR